jgi:hypothetical protein
MSAPPSVVPDAIGLGIFLASVVYAPEVASVVGPYLIIIIAAVIGASFATARRDKSTRLSALWYFSRVTGLAVLLTVVVAGIWSSWQPSVSQRFAIVPVALLIGFFGDDFPYYARRFVGIAWDMADKFRGKGNP